MWFLVQLAFIPCWHNNCCHFRRISLQNNKKFNLTEKKGLLKRYQGKQQKNLQRRAPIPAIASTLHWI